MTDWDADTRYWLRRGDGPWHEVFKQEFISAERTAGFSPKGGSSFDCATGGFTGGGIEGIVTYGEITEKKWGFNPEFFAVASKAPLVLDL